MFMLWCNKMHFTQISSAAAFPLNLFWMFSLKSVILALRLLFTLGGGRLPKLVTGISNWSSQWSRIGTSGTLALGPGSDHQLMAPLSLVSDTLLTPALSGLSPSSSDSRQYEEDSGQRGPTVCVWSLSVRLQ